MRRSLLLVALSLLVSLPLVVAQAPDKADRDEKKTVALPPGTIIAIGDSVVEAWRMMPRGILISPERLKELLDLEKAAKRLTDKTRYRTPSKCALKGEVSGNLVVLRATFDFETDRPGTLVRLACGQGTAKAVSLDGRTPALISEARGTAKGAEASFVVEVDKPGDHTLLLDLAVPVASRPGGVGFTLDLPRAAITSLDLTLPASSRDVKLDGKSPADARVSLKGNHLHSDSLGPAERLDVSWLPPAAAALGAALSAEGTVTVTVEPREVTTEARLVLGVRAGQAKSWPLLLPRGAEVTVAVADKDRVERIDSAEQKGGLMLRTVHLKTASADPLTVTVKTAAPTPRPGKPVAVGPFTVVGATSQTGTVVVSNSAPEWHLELTAHGGLVRHRPSEDELTKWPQFVAAFRYGPEAPAGPAWLDIETESVRGQIKVRPAYTLRLVDDEAGVAWHVEAELAVTPRWSDVDRLVVTMPPGCEWMQDGSYPLDVPRVRSVSYDPSTRQVEFRLGRPAEAASPFKVRVVGRYDGPVEMGGPGMATLPLPRTAGLVEHDSTLRVLVPERTQLVPADTPASLELARRSTHELSYRCPRRPPDRLAVVWRPYSPPVEVSGVIDLTLSPGEARVRHELLFAYPAASGGRSRQRLRVPREVAATLAIVEGEARRDDGFLSFTPSRDTSGKLVLEYDVPLPEGDVFEVPLVVPDQVSRAESKVRVWNDAGPVPVGPLEERNARDGWAETNIEEVAGRPRLPVLVVRSTGSGRPLRLKMSQPGPSARVLIERAVVRVDIAPGGAQEYRVRYRVARLAGPAIDFELPAPAASVGLQASLGGVAIDPVPGPGGRSVRLRLGPALVRQASVLELTYQLAADRQGAAVTTTLQPPRLLDEGANFPVRWQVHAPAGWTIVWPEAGATMPRAWVRSGYLLAPRSALTGADLERWLSGAEPDPDEAEAVPSLVLWRDGDGPVTLTHVPRLGWLLGCSVGLVLLGLLLTRLAWGGAESRGSRWGWAAVLLTAVAAAVGGLLLPGLAAQVTYGSQLGLLVLLACLLVLWLLDERRRRQIVYLANFSRTKPTSSLARKEGNARPGSAHGPPQESTVDAPRPRGSSLEKQGS